jgi:hypothetical protein
MNRLFQGLSLLAVAAAFATAGCGADRSGQPAARAGAKPATGGCPASLRAGWQRLADRIGAPVYCPRWMPDPLFGQITGNPNFGAAGGVSLSVSPADKSYLASFVWAEPGSGEIHVNLRGYPGRTAIPTCVEKQSAKGVVHTVRLPCFSDPRGTVRAPGIVARVYTVNQDADLWHVLYAWRHEGSLYTLSEHVALPLTYAKVVANLNRMLRGLDLVQPAT